MPMVKTDSLQAHPITQANFAASLNTAMVAAGFVLHDSFLSGTSEVRVYREVFDASKTYGTAFFQTTITPTLNLSLTLGTAYNSGTKTLSNAIGSLTFIATTGVDLRYTALNGGSEFRCVNLRQGSSSAIIAQVRPSLNKPSWWNENLYPYWWGTRSLTGSSWNDMQTPGGAALSPWNINWAGRASRTVRGTTPTGQVQIVNAVLWESPSFANPGGPCGVFSNDLAQADGTGKVVGVDKIVVTPGVEEYLILEATPGGLIARIV